MYTESGLNGLNKTQLVAIALELDNKVETLSSGPITADRVKAEYLALKKEGLDIVERRDKAKNDLTEALAKIKADSEKSIAELTLKFGSNDGADAKALDKAYADLEAKSLKVSKDLTFGLEKAENDANIELAKIQEKIDKLQGEYNALVSDIESKSQSLKSKYNEEMSSLYTTHQRKVEDLQYTQKIALRDENMNFIKTAAKQLGQVLVDESALSELENFRASTETELAEIIKDAADSAKSSVYASEGAKFNTLKSQKETEIALLQNDNKHLNTTIQSQNIRIAELESRLKDVPSQIAEAVKSAQSAVTVNQDSTKK